MADVLTIPRRTVLAGLGLLAVPARAAADDRRLVVVVSQGGWDPTFTVDPKPERVTGGPYPDLDASDPEDREVLVDYGPITVTTNARRRPLVRAFFDAWADRTTVVNGLWTGSLGHWQAMDQILTGTLTPGAPDFGVIVGSERGEALPLATVDLSGMARLGPLSARCARAGVRGQLAGLLDPSVRFDTPDGPRPEWALTEEDRDSIARFRAARGNTSPGRAEALERADALRARAETIVEALPAGRRASFGDQIPFAVELLASEACAAVAVGTGYTWDTHGDASRQNGSWNSTFGGLASLCEQLAAAGMLDRTTIVAVSELGRAPTRNTSGGTDHWPYTSALVIGPGGGPRLVGATDEDSVGSGVDLQTGAADPDGPLLSYASFAAGVLTAMGVDAGAWLPGAEPLLLP